mmetsp:Transcript_51523/g.129258  ORF Transcript_51523/g.129258 Transcript_51523/m.129258 type:complete len:918 (+) Transcript_51523:185-2938(+)|eukprot:CAMPEP_0177672860 /NCGR_PEP_ID=MMETSP0447-20121125/25592_1 /TAXON_ID=0 /ORGANISM="Stygamoeba regulata, Strain BSH-02190019" /LENGTH=917 /DNA_ID=CAMNT_0019180607 /DNA_START=142 /DNA_END=2895 /DNA_ORIENTATION=+
MSRFNKLKPPVNYIAGLGRGATGFTTRSDLGSAREATGPATGGGRGASSGGGATQEQHEDLSESNYDQFSGYGSNLFSKDPYEEDDLAADKVWQAIDERMDERRKAQREKRMREELEQFRKERPKVQQQFADLKDGLSELSEADWDAIPEIGDTRAKKQARQTYTPAYTPLPDSVLAGARAQAGEQYHQQLDTSTQYGGAATPMPDVALTQDLAQLGKARTNMLQAQLHRASDSVSGQTVVDPKSYMSGLNSLKINSEAEIGDLKKARLLLSSVTSTNPRHAPGWIAAARLEEFDGKLVAARKLIMRGCEACRKSEDCWLEAARLHTAANAKVILARAVRELPKSVKLWLMAAQLETELRNRKRVLRKALEYVPESVRLWKAAIELEEPKDALVLLGRAVECVPQSVEMWLALAHVETYQNARKVLNKARRKIPTDPQIWITAAKLEEANGNAAAVDMIVSNMLKSLSSHQVYVSRRQWLDHAKTAERAGALATCQALVKHTVGLGVEDVDRKATWVSDAETMLKEGAIETARAVYTHALRHFPGRKGVWLRLANLEKEHGSAAQLDQVLSRAVSYCPNEALLWLMGAKQKWLAGDVPAAREILVNAFKANPNNESIWLAAVKLEVQNDELVRARALLKRARTQCCTARIFLKSALLERECGQAEAEAKLLDEGLAKFPREPKLWLMRAQLECRRQLRDQANAYYLRGLQNCSQSEALWIEAARWAERSHPSPEVGVTKARALLDKARLRLPKRERLWLESVRVEERAHSPLAGPLLSKALQECPQSGLLWAHSIDAEIPQRRKARAFDALKKVNDDPHVIVAVARVFMVARRVRKARSWLQRACTIDPNLGDAWAWYYAFEQKHGGEEAAQAVLSQCVKADPHQGELWIAVSKALGNERLTCEEILKRVAAPLLKD